MNSQQTRQAIDAYVNNHLDDFIADLSRLCAQPSVTGNQGGLSDCAALVADILTEHGFDAELQPTDGQAVVYAQGNGASDKTLLFYLHYDVQPAEPLERWQSPPFSLTRRDDVLVARGVVDDKGHTIARLAALAALRHVHGQLPCQVKFVIEGEEESGSPSLPAYVSSHRERLAADACIWEFGGVDLDDAPTLSLGMRGICYVELRARTAERDIHSGLGGSIMPNAAWRLVWALQTLKDRHDEIHIAGFYDGVRPASEYDMELLASLPDEAERMLSMYGLDHYLGSGFDGPEFRRQMVFEPTCTICGLTAGYQGSGTKTIIPSEATAKVDFRLVPDQSPPEIVAKLRRHLDAEGFTDIEIVPHGSTRPARTDPHHPFVQLTMA
ncbi:MAG: M20/M25/M40 family metallo-hydrolase, partial [Candidatus Promineifilaceae bacterium]|nr:M20/M25/M40 family metallo-hydrolase [Candidatus Promineifilaceae bacterium]